jgi:maleylpyruvate isomerase
VKLYGFFRSSAAYRVRIALNLKKLPYEAIPIHLTKDGGRHKSAEYRAINPQMRVPALVLDDGETILQSLAIVEYLEEKHPSPPLLPKGAVERAHVRAVSQIIASDIHPLNNLVALNYLKKLGHDQASVDEWYRSWVMAGFEASETLLRPGPYCFGAEPGMADLCLVPQVFNARRFKVSLDTFPKIASVEKACARLDAFDKARPENQPDME